MVDCILLSLQELIATHVSYIFMRRLYLPGVFHNSVLRATLRDLNKHFTSSEFHSLSAERIRKEILSLMEHEVWSVNDTSINDNFSYYCYGLVWGVKMAGQTCLVTCQDGIFERQHNGLFITFWNINDGLTRNSIFQMYYLKKLSRVLYHYNNKVYYQLYEL